MAMHGDFHVLKRFSSGHKIVWRTKQVISKHATTLAKQADEHEGFITKVTYCLGVYCFGTICYLLGSRPQDVPYLYCIFFLSTVPLRWVYYRTRKWHYYLLDFCYYANAIFMVALLMYPRSEKLFMICFAISEGPLAWALIVWRCSLVFSSIDKIISVLIHLGPGTVFFILRWWAPMVSQEPQDANAWPAWPEIQSQSAMWTWLFLVPLLVYAVWQILYLLIVNVLRRQTILNDPELMTSYRELARKASRANNIWWRLSGLLGDENRVFMYMVLQGLFTTATLALTVILFMSYKLHMIFEILKLIASIWNGGDWLFEVMPKQANAKKSKQTQALRKEGQVKEEGLACHLCSRQICASRIETYT